MTWVIRIFLRIWLILLDKDVACPRLEETLRFFLL